MLASKKEGSWLVNIKAKNVKSEQDQIQLVIITISAATWFTYIEKLPLIILQLQTNADISHIQFGNDKLNENINSNVVIY